jgi:predicted transcriptional regulator
MFKEEILNNDRRRKIYNFVKKNPGNHLRSLQRILKMPLSSLEYHLDYMVRKRIIIREKDGRFTRYYVEKMKPENKNMLSVLRQKRFREIILIIMSRYKVKFQDLLEMLEIPPSTLSFYLKHLLNYNIINREKIGYENIYTIKDNELVSRVLITYKSSLLDRLIDKAIHTWIETQYGKSIDNSIQK